MTTRAERLQHRLERERRRIAGLLHADTGQFLALAHITLAEIAVDVDPSVAARLLEVRRYLVAVEERLRQAAAGLDL